LEKRGFVEGAKAKLLEFDLVLMTEEEAAAAMAQRSLA
jgi:hypothetical protein